MRLLQRPRRHEATAGPDGTVREYALLLIDDDKEEAVVLGHALERILDTHYRLDWVATVGDALEEIERGRHDAYLVDYRLGASDGLELIREARARGCRAPLIVLTSARDRAVDLAATEAGATDFLEKRADPLLIDRTLRYAISQARTLQELERSYEHIRALEEIGRLLADEGPAHDVLDQVVEILANRLRYRYVSLYLADRGQLRLVSQRGYENPQTSIDPRSGVLARLTEVDQPRFVPPLTPDPDYRLDGTRISIELAVPLFTRGEFAGLLNVGSAAASAIGEADHRVITTMAARVALGMELAREREEVAARARRLRTITDLAVRINRDLDADELCREVVDAVGGVVPADDISIALPNAATGTWVVAASSGIGLHRPGSAIDVRQTHVARALEDAAVHVGQGEAVVPLVREQRVIGLLVLTRGSDAAPFTAFELEGMPLVGHQVALALSPRLQELNVPPPDAG